MKQVSERRSRKQVEALQSRECLEIIKSVSIESVVAHMELQLSRQMNPAENRKCQSSPRY